MEVTGKSGAKYQIEIEGFWDDKAQGNLRIGVNIDDGGIRVFVPIGEDFIISQQILLLTNLGLEFDSSKNAVMEIL